MGFLDQAMKIYLNRKHRTIGMTPMQGDMNENEDEIQTGYFKRYKK